MKNVGTLSLLLVQAVRADSSCSSAVGQDIITSDMLKWLQENGAYINQKLEVRNVPLDGGESFRGVFANEEMDADEIVCKIPWKLMFKPNEEFKKDTAAKESDCGTIQAVFEAMSMGEDEMTPYARYLLAQSGVTAGFWSDDARSLLLDMLKSNRTNHLTGYDELPPHGVDEIVDDVKQECHADINNKLYRHAAMMVKTRADYQYLVPFYDMTNHHNGKTNVKHLYDPFGPSAHLDETGYEMVATKKIHQGEELFLSYNQCNICQTYVDWFGTPEMFLHYGFVEPLPQRWLFDFARVKFDLDWKNGNASSGEMEVTYLVPPSEKGVALLQDELKRLHTFSMKHRSMDLEGLGISSSEWKSLWQYYDALYDAMSLAVHQSKNASVTDEVWNLGDDWWVKNGTTKAEEIDEHWVYPIENSFDIEEVSSLF